MWKTLFCNNILYMIIYYRIYKYNIKNMETASSIVDKIDIKTWNEEIDEMTKDWVLSTEEIKEISRMYEKAIDIDWKKEIKDQIDSLLKKETIWNLNLLKDEIENISPSWWFNSFKSSFEKVPDQYNYITMLWEFFELKLDKNMSIEEKDTAKMQLVSEIGKNIDLKKLWEKFQKVIKDFSELKTEDEKQKFIKDKDNLFKSELQGIGEIDEKIEEINKDYKEWNEKPSKKINEVSKAETKTDVEKAVKEMTPENKEELANKVKNEWQSSLEKMFPWNDFLSKFFKFFLSLLWWKDMLSWNNESQKKSVDSLKKYSDENSSILDWKLDTQELKDLKPEELKDFYEFLDGENIDYKWEDFWKELLTWEGLKEGDKLYKIHKELLGEDWKILGEKEGKKDFLSKLNWLKGVSVDKNEEKVNTTKNSEKIVEVKPVDEIWTTEDVVSQF